MTNSDHPGFDVWVSEHLDRHPADDLIIDVGHRNRSGVAAKRDVVVLGTVSLDFHIGHKDLSTVRISSPVAATALVRGVVCSMKSSVPHCSGGCSPRREIAGTCRRRRFDNGADIVVPNPLPGREASHLSELLANSVRALVVLSVNDPVVVTHALENALALLIRSVRVREVGHALIASRAVR